MSVASCELNDVGDAIGNSPTTVGYLLSPAGNIVGV
jgi:hypothetical protein